MKNELRDFFIDTTKKYAKNPLGIIALFIWLVYLVAGSVLSLSVSYLEGSWQRMPLIFFIVIFPCVILAVFTYLVVYHHEKLYAPSDYKDEKNFVTFARDKEVTNRLEKVRVELDSLASRGDKIDDDQLISKINKISEEIENIKEKSEKSIPINNLWRLNHWGGSCASIVDGKMIFTGTSVPGETDGCHIDLNNMLEIGKSYEISCIAKSDPGTNGMFQLWCHDKTGEKPDGVDVSTQYKIPSTEGEKIKLKFKAEYNSSVRIHLQYKPGQGRITVSDVQVSELI
jgi:hypothetical protein